jgi:L-malate glycosyltransferase
MKISFVIPFVSRSGAIRVIFEYANRLSERGHDVVVYFPFWPLNYRGKISFMKLINLVKRFFNKFKGLIFKKEAETTSLFSESRFKIKQIPFINNFFMDDADAVITSFWPAALKISNLKKSKGDKIYFVQANESSFISDEKWVKKSFKPEFRYVCVSNYSANIIKQKYGFDSKVILNGINFDIFYNNKKNFNRDEINISFINSTNKIKRVGNIIEAINKLNLKFDNLSFTSFGENDSSGLPDFIEYFQNPDDDMIRNIYSNSDIFIMASREEACPLSPAEAMACKCAVISTPVGGFVEYSIKNETALYVEFESTDDIVTAASALIMDNNLREKISIAGYNLVRDIMNWNHAVDSLEKFIRQDAH